MNKFIRKNINQVSPGVAESSSTSMSSAYSLITCLCKAHLPWGFSIVDADSLWVIRRVIRFLIFRGLLQGLGSWSSGLSINCGLIVVFASSCSFRAYRFRVIKSWENFHLLWLRIMIARKFFPFLSFSKGNVWCLCVRYDVISLKALKLVVNFPFYWGLQDLSIE